MRLRTTAGIGLAALLLASLAACADDDSGASPSDPDSSTTTASTSPTTEPSPTVTDTGPSIPTDAQGTDEASAKAFVRFYFATLSEAMQTGDTEALRQLATKKCKTCRTVPARIRNVYSKGGSLQTEGWKVANVVTYAEESRSLGFYLKVIETESQLFDEDGKRVTTTPESESSSRIVITRGPGRWLIDEWAFIE
ncbi:DUF6318 family protein [Nocardioides sp. Root151]|uniref:DUF6318 family protein n=1 Tax=Nocardioides sp. Root151 TaxID=1736475 RepID=UPI0007033C96|nr:DUF6318 family protein [Nocardioides sp. Root151]KQZ67039.1 hypothetical protein ASD66_18780 [Nocardioides sp. Root151]